MRQRTARWEKQEAGIRDLLLLRWCRDSPASPLSEQQPHSCTRRPVVCGGVQMRHADAAQMEQDSGAVQYDDPIAQWWPAYLGKQATEELAQLRRGGLHWT